MVLSGKIIVTVHPQVWGFEGMIQRFDIAAIDINK